MPRSGAGTYQLPANALAIPNSTASSTFYNNALTDIATALTGSASADGQTTLTGAFKGYAGTAGAPTWTFAADATTGFYQSAAGKLTASVSGNKAFEQDSTGFSDGAAITVASAATTNLAATPSNNIIISGTTAITSLGTASDGVKKYVKFTGILTLAYNSTSLVLPGAANITTGVGDQAIFVSRGSGNWECVSYLRSNGLPVVNPTGAVTNIATSGYVTGGPITSTGTVSLGNMNAASRLLGSASSSSGITDITLGTGLTMVSNVLNSTPGTITSIATSGYVSGGTITTSGTITLGNMGGVSRLLGSGTVSAAISDITVGSGLTMTGTTLSANATVGGFTTIVRLTASSGNWTVPAGVTRIKVTAIAGGGGSGGLNGSAGTIGTGGGGAGGTAVAYLTVTPGTSIPYTVGAAGAAGASGSGTGGAGGNTTFNTSSVVANGGNGSTGTTSGFTAGGAGGSGTTGDWLMTGGTGGTGAGLGTPGGVAQLGSSTYGAGAAGQFVASGSGAAAGLAGSPGVIYIEY